MYMTDEGSNYKDFIGYAAIRAKVDKKMDEPYSGPVEVFLEFHYADRRRRDVDGAIKLTLDAIEGIVYLNDYQVYSLHVKKFHEKEDMVKIKVVPY